MRKKRQYKTKAEGYDKNDHKHDEYFKDLVKRNILSVSEDGVVINKLTNNVLGKSKTTKNKYVVIGYFENGITRHILVHRLVWIIFVGPTGAKVINHINGIKNDNRLVNLELLTEAENNRHAFKTGLHKPSEKQRQSSRERMIKNNANPNRKNLSEDDIREIRRLSTPYKKGNDKKLAEKYNTCRELITQIRRNIIYKWVV